MSVTVFTSFAQETEDTEEEIYKLPTQNVTAQKRVESHISQVTDCQEHSDQNSLWHFDMSDAEKPIQTLCS